MTGWSDAPSVMLAAAAAHADVSSTVYYAVWCRANYFFVLWKCPLGGLPVAAHVLRVGPGPEVVLFLNADSAGSVYTIQDACNRPLTPGRFKIIISELKEQGLILTVFTTQLAQQLDGLFAASPGPLGMLLIDTICYMMCPHLSLQRRASRRH